VVLDQKKRINIGRTSDESRPFLRQVISLRQTFWQKNQDYFQKNQDHFQKNQDCFQKYKDYFQKNQAFGQNIEETC
jgi:uncharacterized alpha/beta hydrolase family protein